jgi:hypothetical protein
VVNFTGANYSIKTLGTPSVTQYDTTPAGDRAYVDGQDVVWASLGPSATQVSYAYLYDDDDPNDVVIAYWLIDTNFPNGGDYTVAWAAPPAGILYIG